MRIKLEEIYPIYLKLKVSELVDTKPKVSDAKEHFCAVIAEDPSLRAEKVRVGARKLVEELPQKAATSLLGFAGKQQPI